MGLRAEREGAPYSPEELDATGASIAAIQSPDGMIPWFENGHADPWNHVEAAMALTATGRHDASEAAYSWLASVQREDGSWHAHYGDGGTVEEERLDTNVTAYIATGVRHHHLATGDDGFLEQMWPVVEAALEWVLRWQQPGGELAWAVSPSGVLIGAGPPGHGMGAVALLAACSSVCTSLRAGIACARACDLERPAWERALVRLVDAIASRPSAFAPKPEFAMDWYYPVLAGALDPLRSDRRIERGWPTWVVADRGVRCRSDGAWVTTAETAECAIACARIGRTEDASRLLGWTRAHRQPDGSFATGLVHPDGTEFPPGERSTYSGAAVVLAADLLARSPATVDVFG